MRISKLFLVVCVAALGAGVAAARADDNPAQAAARAALEEKMGKLNTQSETTNGQPSVSAKSAQPARPAKTAAPANRPPVEKPQTAAPATLQHPAKAATAPVATAPAQNPQATETHQTQQPPVTVTPSGAAMHEPTNPPPAATVTMPSTPAPAEKPAMTATRSSTPATASSGRGLFAPVPPPSGGVPIQPVPEKNMPPSKVPTAPAAVPSIPNEPSQTANANFPGKVLGLKPIQAPPPPISPMQQAQLQALLEKYDANAITPEQYQAERSKIMAEPR